MFVQSFMEPEAGIARERLACACTKARCVKSVKAIRKSLVLTWTNFFSVDPDVEDPTRRGRCEYTPHVVFSLLSPEAVAIAKSYLEYLAAIEIVKAS